MGIADYRDEVVRQLSNEKYYRKLPSKPVEEVRRKIIECVQDIEKDCVATAEEFDILPTQVRTPNFYVLQKIH